MVRVNFEVDPETKRRIEDAMESLELDSQRQLFAKALDTLLREQSLVRDENRAIVAIRASLLGKASRVLGDVMILERPRRSKTDWLVMRPGDWRSTPWIKGTRLHVSDIRSLRRTEPDFDAETLADELSIPPTAATEALDYIEEHEELLAAEEREAGRRSKRGRAGAVTPR